MSKFCLESECQYIVRCQGNESDGGKMLPETTEEQEMRWQNIRK